MSVATAALAEVAEINPRFDRAGFANQGEVVTFVPMARVSELSGVITSEDHRPLGELLKGFTPFADRDVLVAKITPCFENGKIAHARISKRAGFGSTEFHVVRADAQRLDDRYLFHFLRQPLIRVAGEKRMTGSGGQRRVPKAFLESLKIPLPPLAEQRRISAILDKADALRAKRREAIAKLDQLLQSVFLDMFGDPSENPFGWPVCELGELLKDGPQNGLYKPAQDYGYGTPILRIDGYRAGDIIRAAPRKRVRLTDAEIVKYELRPLDIVINRVNSPEHLGKPALVQEIPESTVFESNMMRMSVDRDAVDPHYLITYLVQRFVRNQIAARRKDAINQSSINQDDVKSLAINVPPVALQDRFKSIVTRILRQRHEVFPSAVALDSLFTSLQNRAFTGTL